MLFDWTNGACFNDLTRMVMDPHERFVQDWESSQMGTPEAMDPRKGPETKKFSLIRPG
jgi:polo-like kinase 1